MIRAYLGAGILDPGQEKRHLARIGGVDRVVVLGSRHGLDAHAEPVEQPQPASLRVVRVVALEGRS